MPHRPPRLLLGCALLFWGAMTGRPLLGLLLALVAEGSHWTRVRWDFDDAACGRAWRLSVGAIVVAAALIWLDGNRYSALSVLLSWAPLLLMPMQFVQSYGLRDAMPVSELSFLAKRRRERNLRLGLDNASVVFNFGNVLFTTALIAASVGAEAASWMFLPGIVILAGWMLMSAGHGRIASLVPILLMAGLLAMGGRIALERAERWFGGAGEYGRRGFDPNFTSTMIGRTGTINQSPDVVWRLWSAPGTAPPRLLRTATFNTFLGTNWQNQRVAADDFSPLDSRLIGDVTHYTLWENSYDPSTGPLPSYRLRGSAAEESPLPLPGDAAALRDFELDGVERNTLGTVRVYPANPVIDGTVLWRGDGNPEAAPLPEEDLRVPLADREVIGSTLRELGIKADMPLREKTDRIRAWFLGDFRYTRELGINHSPYRIAGPSAISRFLTTERAGHCEYFATSAALLLRMAGVPARYATGYALIERDATRGGHVIRGTHGHAWCRVWDEPTGRWTDFDPTPPGWTSTLDMRITAAQRINDAIKRLREDFFLWRTDPENQLGVTLAMTLVGLGMAGFIARRLWLSRREIDLDPATGGRAGSGTRTPLHDLEKAAIRHLGSRPPGMPYAAWLRKLDSHLPDAAALEQAIALHQQLRFDPAPAEAGTKGRLGTLARQLAAQLSQRHATRR